MTGCERNLPGLRQRQVVGSCTHGIELTFPTKFQEVLIIWETAMFLRSTLITRTSYFGTHKISWPCNTHSIYLSGVVLGPFGSNFFTLRMAVNTGCVLPYKQPPVSWNASDSQPCRCSTYHSYGSYKKLTLIHGRVIIIRHSVQFSNIWTTWTLSSNADTHFCWSRPSAQLCDACATKMSCAVTNFKRLSDDGLAMWQLTIYLSHTTSTICELSPIFTVSLTLSLSLLTLGCNGNGYIVPSALLFPLW
jgi:hypothetical protein